MSTFLDERSCRHAKGLGEQQCYSCKQYRLVAPLIVMEKGCILNQSRNMAGPSRGCGKANIPDILKIVVASRRHTLHGKRRVLREVDVYIRWEWTPSRKSLCLHHPSIDKASTDILFSHNRSPRTAVSQRLATFIHSLRGLRPSIKSFASTASSSATNPTYSSHPIRNIGDLAQCVTLTTSLSSTLPLRPLLLPLWWRTGSFRASPFPVFPFLRKL